MSKFAVINIKEGTCDIVEGKTEVGRIIEVSVPTITKWFADRDVYLHEDKVIGCAGGMKSKKSK